MQNITQRKIIDASSPDVFDAEIEQVKAPRQRLLQIHEMPRYLQFNPYIISGYRNMLSTKGSVKSLFYFHNETINILTHGKCTRRLIPAQILLIPDSRHTDNLYTVDRAAADSVGKDQHSISTILPHSWKRLSLGRKLFISFVYEPCSRRGTTLPQTFATRYVGDLGHSKFW